MITAAQGNLENSTSGLLRIRCRLRFAGPFPVLRDPTACPKVHYLPPAACPRLTYGLPVSHTRSPVAGPRGRIPGYLNEVGRCPSGRAHTEEERVP
jgi:hypothetical protein